MAVVTVDVPLVPGAPETDVGEAEMVNPGVDDAVTVNETVAAFVIPLPVPVTMMGYVPAGVDDPTVKVTSEVPEPGAASDAGLNNAVVPVGRPNALKTIAELKAPEATVAIVLLPVEPCAMETAFGEAEIVKASGGVTVRRTVAVGCVVLAPVPVMRIGYEPTGVLEDTATIMVEVPAPGAAMDMGLKLTVTPVRRPDAERATAELKPPEMAIVMVDVPLLPCATEIELGEAETVNVAVAGMAPSASIRPVPFGLPQPVTRS